MVEYYKNRGPSKPQIYEVEGANKDKTDRQITGTYVPFELFEEIKSWMKFKKTSKSGVVYVITNTNLEPQFIHKIGYAQNLDNRLETFNKYRKFEPCFYQKLVYESENAKNLETKIHLALKQYSQGNEFFKVSLDRIEAAFSELGCIPVEKHNTSIMVTLNDICYTCIKDTFYYGLFGDFKVVIDQKTGYFNATKLCQLGGKNFFEWKRLEKSKKMVEYYQRNWPDYSQANFLYEVKDANKDKIGKQVTGTYVPKELILDIASWISVEFYDKCNNIIINYFVNEFKKMDKNKLQTKIKEVEECMERMTLQHEDAVKVKDDKIDELAATVIRVEQSNQRLEQYVRSLGISLEEVKDQNEELLDRNNELLDCNKDLKKDVKKVQRKLGIAVEDRAPLPEDKSKYERFVLIKRNDEEYYAYYTIRAQDDYHDGLWPS